MTDTNPIGQLTAEWQQPGACPATPVTTLPSNAIGVRIRSKHDAMGRVGMDKQCLTASNCSSTTVGVFNYSYNLMGSQVQSNNGIAAGTVTASQIGTNATPMSAPSVTWMTSYDVAGHIQQAYVQDQPNSTNWPVNSVGAAFSTDPDPDETHRI